MKTQLLIPDWYVLCMFIIYPLLQAKFREYNDHYVGMSILAICVRPNRIVKDFKNPSPYVHLHLTSFNPWNAIMHCYMALFYTLMWFYRREWYLILTSASSLAYLVFICTMWGQLNGTQICNMWGTKCTGTVSIINTICSVTVFTLLLTWPCNGW